MEESGVKEGTCVVYTPHTTAAIVYNSGVNLVAIGLDVATHFDVNLTENDIAALDKSDKMEQDFSARLSDLSIEEVLRLIVRSLTVWLLPMPLTNH